MGHMKEGAMLQALEMQECFLKAGKGKGPDSPLEPLEACWHLDFLQWNWFWTSDFQNC